MPELLNPVPQLIMDMVSVNLTKKPFDDIRVRTALNLAINREAITERIVLVGNASPPIMWCCRIAGFRRQCLLVQDRALSRAHRQGPKPDA